MLTWRSHAAGNTRPIAETPAHVAKTWKTSALSRALCLRNNLAQTSNMHTLGSKVTTASALHGGRELEIGYANIVVTAVQEDVGLRGRGAQGERKCLKYNLKPPK